MLFDSAKFTHLEFQGTRPFYEIINGIKNSKSILNLEYPNKLSIQEIVKDIDVQYIANPNIATKLEQIKRYKTEAIKEASEYENELHEYELQKQQIAIEEDLIKKEMLMMKFSKMKAPTLESDIRNLRNEDQLSYNKALKESRQEPLMFSGTFTKLIINDKNI
jgi:hypothetical protein